MTASERYHAILANHLPAVAVETVYNYLDRHRVHFHITRGRRSKLGDYRPTTPQHPQHEMSVNGDLNPYLFLWVFIHEAAHLEAHEHYGARIQPHGREWQGVYARLLAGWAPLLPPEVQQLVAAYASRLPLRKALQLQIEELLHRYDKGYSATEHVHLNDLAAGSRFRLKTQPEHLFEAVERRRTRWLCRDTESGKMYTVAGTAEVEGER